MNGVQGIFLLLASNAFRFYVLWRGTCRMCSDYVLSENQMISFLICYIIDSICIVFFPTSSLYLFISISILAALVVFHQASVYEKYLFAFTIPAMFLISSIINSYVFDGHSLLASGEVFANLIFFILELLWEAFYYYRKLQPKQPEWYLLCLIPGSSVLLLYFMEKANLPVNASVILGAVILWLNIFIFYYYDALTSSYINLLQGQQMMLQMRLYEEHMRQSENAEEQMAAFRHDLKNHLFALDILAQEKKIDAIRKYLAEMENGLEMTKVNHFTNCRPAEMILEYFVHKMKNAGISPEIFVSIPENTNWNMYDMNILLSNLLENAIEAAIPTKEKRICLKMQYEHGLLKLELENSYSGTLKISDGNYLTTKQMESSRHGYGLKNVRQVVEKYSGEIVFEQKDQSFRVKALLYM